MLKVISLGIEFQLEMEMELELELEEGSSEGSGRTTDEIGRRGFRQKKLDALTAPFSSR